MKPSGETLWIGGPRTCLLHRGFCAGAEVSGIHSSHLSYQAQITCLLSRGPPFYGRTGALQNLACSTRSCCSLNLKCSLADWKHRRRKAALGCKSSVTKVHMHEALQGSPRFIQSNRHHHAFHHIQHQLDRRWQHRVQSSAEDLSNPSSSSDHPASVPTWSDAATPEPPDHAPPRFAIDRDLEVDEDDKEPQPTEAGVLPESRLPSGQSKPTRPSQSPSSAAGPKLIREAASAASSVSAQYATNAGLVYSPAQRNQIKESWSSLMRWSRVLRDRTENGSCALERIDKVVVFGGGSFGTAMAAVLARQKSGLEVVLLLRDPYTCHAINHEHINSRYLEVSNGCLPTACTVCL